MGALPSAPGLADVVRRHLPDLRPLLAGTVPAAAADQRPGHTAPVAAQPFPGLPARPCASAPVPLPIQHPGGVAPRPCVVAPRRGRRLRAAHRPRLPADPARLSRPEADQVRTERCPTPT